MTSSTLHRCFMLSEQINKLGHISKVFTGNLILNKIPNLFRHYMNWKKINNDRPDVLILHRTSNIVDYHMVKNQIKNYKIVFDFDDAIFHTRFPGILNYNYLPKILNLCDAVNAGSHYLENYAKNFNPNIFLIPTSVDIELFTENNINKNTNEIVIGWLGGGVGHQLNYLKLVKEPLEILSKKYNIKFKMVSALSQEVRDEFENVNFNVDYGLDYWVPIEKIPGLIADFDIGVMPLIDSPFEKGKCSMKALEYMSMGKPVVASNVGENNYVIKNGFNGYLSSNTIEWVENIEKLISNKNIREKMGKNGRKFVKNNYSLNVIAEKIVQIAEDLYAH